MYSIRSLQSTVKNYFLQNHARNLIFLVIMIFFTFLFYFNSWIGDDAFISMRIVDNWIHGYGLVWNIGERVQAFSHPLWLFLVTLTYLVIKDPYYTLYVLSLNISLLTVFLFLKYFAVQMKSMIFFGFILASSMSFIDFSSSGLENPLSHLIIIIGLIAIFHMENSPRRLILIASIAAFSALNRLDTILIYLPILIYEYLENREILRTRLITLIIGFAPLWIWFLFSIFYYGFPFPNTFYAKLADNLPLNWYIENGVHYYLNLIKWDFITFLIIILSVVFTVVERKKKNLLLMTGAILYMLYILFIGGDFMAGRFFSIIFLLSLVLLADVDVVKLFPVVGKVRFKYIILLGIFCCFVSKYPPILIKLVSAHWVFDEYQISNEKYYYYKKTNWQKYDAEKSLFNWCNVGLEMKYSGERTFVFNSIGFVGYYAGPDVYIIDGFALTDPLLARLPTYDYSRIGHFTRRIPEGYEKTVNANFDNQIVNQSLKQYYDKLSILIHDPVFSKGRINEIYYFTVGEYDYLLENYNKKLE